MKKFLMCMFLLCTIVVFTTPAFAGFANVVSFGDSLSDDGPSNGHGFGRYTDGPIWVELLAGSYGANLYDYAYGGAASGYGNPFHPFDTTITGLNWQVEENDIQSTINGLSGDTLFTVWAGANDLNYVDNTGSNIVSIAQTAANNIINALTTLEGLGADNILVPNLPDIGLTPRFYGTIAGGGATAYSNLFNNFLAVDLQNFADNFNGTLYTLDVFGLFNEFTPGTDAWQFMFWNDDFHPSMAGHYMISRLDFDVVVPMPTPIPGAILLFCSGLVGIAGLRRKAA